MPESNLCSLVVGDRGLVTVVNGVFSFRVPMWRELEGATWFGMGVAQGEEFVSVIYILKSQLFALKYTLKYSLIKNKLISTPTCFGLIRPSSGSCRA